VAYLLQYPAAVKPTPVSGSLAARLVILATAGAGSLLTLGPSESLRRMPENIRSRKSVPGSANPNECYTCLGPVEHWHHVVPYSMGGNITLPLCENCHGKIHNKDLVSMQALAIAGARRMALDGNFHSQKYSDEVVEKCVYLYKIQNLTYTQIAQILIDDEIFVRSKDWKPAPSQIHKYWNSKPKYSLDHYYESCYRSVMSISVRQLIARHYKRLSWSNSATDPIESVVITSSAASQIKLFNF